MGLRLIFIFLLLSKICVSNIQEDSLTFMVNIKVYKDSLHDPISNASIRVISTNGTDTVLYSNSIGEITYKTHEVGSFTLIANYKGFYSLTNYFTTLRAKQDSNFYLEFAMKKIIVCVMYFPVVNFEINKDSVVIDSLRYIYNTLFENPTLVMQVIGHQTDQEENGLSKKRAISVRKALRNKGIHRKRLKIVDGKNEKPTNPYCLGNRCVTFRILTDDFKVK